MINITNYTNISLSHNHAELIFLGLCLLAGIFYSFIVYSAGMFGKISAACSLLSLIAFLLVFFYIYSNYYVILTLIVLFCIWLAFNFLLFASAKLLINKLENSLIVTTVTIVASILYFLFPLITYLVANSNRIITINLTGMPGFYRIDSIVIDKCPNGTYYFALETNYNKLIPNDIYRSKDLPSNGQCIKVTVVDNRIEKCELIRDGKNVEYLFYIIHNPLVKPQLVVFGGFDKDGMAIHSINEDVYQREFEDWRTSIESK